MRGSYTCKGCDKQAQGTSSNVAVCITLMSQGGSEGISERLVLMSLQERVTQSDTLFRKFHECHLPLWFPFT